MRGSHRRVLQRRSGRDDNARRVIERSRPDLPRDGSFHFRGAVSLRFQIGTLPKMLSRKNKTLHPLSRMERLERIAPPLPSRRISRSPDRLTGGKPGADFGLPVKAWPNCAHPGPLSLVCLPDRDFPPSTRSMQSKFVAAFCAAKFCEKELGRASCVIATASTAMCVMNKKINAIYFWR
jgi:hypothetical protein